jgi:hypothetical protein
MSMRQGPDFPGPMHIRRAGGRKPYPLLRQSRGVGRYEKAELIEGLRPASANSRLPGEPYNTCDDR